ncbi:GNAT family N-acetyltransferase [Lichenihabitans psoromatis]|uniref:GNAT family N-acetyltransferase n=1 Tax=Lichenihabitans psoromatis TaxID=2528642 RepID=UPI0013F15C3C|nr:GNAT family N-acetyltransferase [Lichenihabitans psoromatis]
MEDLYQPVHEIETGWCRDPAIASDIARLFVAGADPSYISHSELQFGRAETPDRWASDLGAIILSSATKAIADAARPTTDPHTKLAVATANGTIVGFAFVSFMPGVRTPFATLEDLLVTGARGQGAGRAMLDWIARTCRTAGFLRLFLESGARNDRAHHFFERHGFEQVSIVMKRDLPGLDDQSSP